MDNTDSKSSMRVLKVYRGHYCTGSHHVYKPHPVIRLSGVYLSELDFQIGDRIEVRMKRGAIVILKIKP